MKSHPPLQITTLLSLLSAGFLIACSDSSQQAAGEKLDQSVAMAQQKGDEIQSDVKQSAAKLEDQASAMATEAKNAMSDATITAQVNASLARIRAR
jgi:citrate lyase gamma subunit